MGTMNRSWLRQNACFIGLCLALVALVFAAYSNHFDNPFQFDDQNTIVANSYEHELRNISGFFTDIRTSNVLPANRDYRPVLSSFYALNYVVGDGNTFAFHVSIFACFVLLGVALFFFSKKIFDVVQRSERNKFLALGTAGFYALHTANAETINYIHAASDSLSTLMIVVSLVLFQYGNRYRKYGFYLLPVVCGMLIKITVAIYPLLLFGYVLLFETVECEGRICRLWAWPSLRKALGQALPSLAVCFGLLALWRIMLPPTFAPSLYSRLDYALAQPFVLVHYLNSFLLPLNLSADADWGAVAHVGDDRVLAGVIILTALLVTAWHCARQQHTRPIGFGILWFFAASLPTSSGIIPMGEVMNDHRMFLPFIGLTLSAGWAVGLLLSRFPTVAPRLAMVVLPCLFLLHAYGVHERNKVWQSDENLWYDVTLKSPQNGRGLMNYGTTQMAKGLYERALFYYQRALIYTPDYSFLHINLGILTDAMGQTDEAEAYFKNAIRYGDNYPDVYYYYARFLDEHGRSAESIPLLVKAIDMSPGALDARFLLMKIYAARSEWQALAALAQATQHVAPNDPRIADYLALAEKNDPAAFSP